MQLSATAKESPKQVDEKSYLKLGKGMYNVSNKLDRLTK